MATGIGILLKVRGQNQWVQIPHYASELAQKSADALVAKTSGQFETVIVFDLAGWRDPQTIPSS